MFSHDMSVLADNMDFIEDTFTKSGGGQPAWPQGGSPLKSQDDVTNHVPATQHAPPGTPVVVLSCRGLSTSPPSPAMYWNARLNAAGKQYGFWNSDPQHGKPAGKMGGWHVAMGTGAANRAN